MSDVTQLLDAAAAGDPRAATVLLPLVYDELRKLAAARMAGEKPGHTLQPTALVHEAYLRLVGGAERGWDSRGHFFAAAAEAMRRIVVEAARRKNRVKHGGGHEQVEVELADLPTRLPPDDLIALDDALTRLEQLDPVKARLVTLRYFAGLTVEQAVRVLGIATAAGVPHHTSFGTHPKEVNAAAMPCSPASGRPAGRARASRAFVSLHISTGTSRRRCASSRPRTGGRAGRPGCTGGDTPRGAAGGGGRIGPR